MNLDREAYFFSPKYTRGQVCKVMGVTKDTLRHYENCGLINPQEDKHNRYKYYSIADLEILNVILFLRSVDVAIQDIPKFINCKEIESYGDLLSQQIEKITLKINYWTYVRDLLSYFQQNLEAYKCNPRQVRIVQDIQFRFCQTKFDYSSDNLEKMTPKHVDNIPIYYHVTKLKIVGEKWISSNREDTSDMVVGHLCHEDEKEDICIHTLPKALMITTLEVLDKLPQIITEFREDYKEKYELDDKSYIVEHAFFNVFNQGELLRNIYLPIKNNKLDDKK